MNLALHGFFLQVFVLILDLQHGFRLCSAGEPGYLDFDNLPETNFSCQGKVIGGYYADVEAGCQMFHVCTIGQKDEIMDIKFLCLNGTVFDQETRVCERVDEVDCSKSERFYNLNLELYGNNAVTLSLHENSEDVDDPSEVIEDHQQRSTSARPATTTTTSTTTSRPIQPSTTAASGSFQHPTGYPQHYQPQPTFPQVHTSQSKSLYDDKNGGYHHQYIFHNGERNDNQATSYQLFSNQGVSSTTVQPPQVHQVRFSSTSGPQIIHNEPSTVSPLFHATSSTIQTLLSNANAPALINPIFHSHGIASTTEQYSVHNNNPRETSEYQEEEQHEQSIRVLEAVQSTNQGKVSKLTISPVPSSESTRSTQSKSSQSSQQQRISGNFLPTPASIETTIRSFYPTPRTSSKSSFSSSSGDQVAHHIHVPPPPPIPQLKPQQITINLPPPDLQRLIQNPPALLPSQSRVIVTAKASVSDESGRPLNTTQIVTLPLPTIPSSYDDYKEGDESFDPFYRDVPKIHNNRRIVKSTSEVVNSERRRRSTRPDEDALREFIYGAKNVGTDGRDLGGRKSRLQKRSLREKEDSRTRVVYGADENTNPVEAEEGKPVGNDENLEEALMKFRDMLFNGKSTFNVTREVVESVEDLVTKASRYRKVQQEKDSKEDGAGRGKSEVDDREESKGEESDKNGETDTRISDAEEYVQEEKQSGKSSDDEKEYLSSLNTKESDAEEYIATEEDSKTKLDSEENKEFVSSLNTKHSDAEEYVETDSGKDKEFISTLNTRESDAEEYIATEHSDPEMKKEFISALNTKESDAEEYIAPSSVSSGEISGPEESGKSEESSAENDKSLMKDETIEDENSNGKSRNSGEESEGIESEVVDEVKPHSRRKGHSRSSRKRLSARRKSHKQQSTQNENTDPKTGRKMTTTTLSVLHLETETDRRIDGQILEDPESQTPKELGTRAVAQSDAKHLKHQRKNSEIDTGKNNQKNRVNLLESTKKYENNIDREEKPSVELEKSDEEVHFRSESIEESEDKNLKERKSLRKSLEEAHSVEEDETSTEVTSRSRESEMSTERIHSLEEFASTEDFSEERSTLPRRKNGEHDVSEESGSDEISSTRSSERIYSDELSSEYPYSQEESYEGTREASFDEDYRESLSPEEVFTSTEVTSSEELSDSREIVGESKESAGSREDQSTEGILKFTDELPDTEERNDATEKSEKEDSMDTSRDYVDDNYEPENYKAPGSSSRSEDSSEEKMKEDKAKSKKTKSKAEEKEFVGLQKDEDKEDREEEEDSKDNSGELSKEDVEESAMMTTTTTTTTTTSSTTLPSSPKLFRPFTMRKSYNYIPPTTTPNPVVIKPRTVLLNPKPAKPPKSYNELAPKPVIRKLPLLTRKTTTTPGTTTTEHHVVSESSTENLIATTESRQTEKHDPESKSMSEEGHKNHAEISREEIEISTENMADRVEQSTEENVFSAERVEEQTGSKRIHNFTPYPATKFSTTSEQADTVPEDSGIEESKVRDVTTESTISQTTEENMEETIIPTTLENLTSTSDKLDSTTAKISTSTNPEETDSDAKSTTSNTSDSADIERITLSTLSKMVPVTSQSSVLLDVVSVSTTSAPTTLSSTESADDETSTDNPKESDDYAMLEDMKIATTTPSNGETIVESLDTTSTTTPQEALSSDPGFATTAKILDSSEAVDVASSTTPRPLEQKIIKQKRYGGFNCLEKEMYRFYGDARDCRLFHYCSPGFTSRQVLDFRFVCEEGTAFDEQTQSCRHDIRNNKCANRHW